MACVATYSFLMISICLRSCSWADEMVQVTPLFGAVGNEIIIQCATDKTPQDGVYMYKQEEANKNKQKLFYYYKDDTFSPKSTMYKTRVHVDGKIPNLNVTFSNLNTTDTGLYWCEFNFEDKITVSTITWLWIEEKVDEPGEGHKKVCPDVPHTKILHFLCAVILLLCIICLVFVILKVRECWKTHHQTTL
uniref:Immunoglobulin V-set domain-containing protein n=1 Tax=Cyprinus carpio TaxID=7962 RepID=A0A8C2CR48_CYPCA